MSKPNITMLPVEAYALPSGYGMQDSTHTFIVGTSDRTIQWTNGGGGWSDTREKTRVAQTTLYYEWANNFIPRPTGYAQGGIRFSVNGVCHTIANRVLAVANSSADVRLAKKDEFSIVFYGKYGLGLNEFKQKLRESFDKTKQTHEMPSGALDTVLRRVDNAVDDELLSWRLIAISVGGIDVDGIIARSGGIAIARRRLQAYIDYRESLFDRYLQGSLTSGGLQQEIKKGIQSHAGNYLDFLCGLGLISKADCTLFHSRLDAFLNQFIRGVQAQLAALQSGQIL